MRQFRNSVNNGCVVLQVLVYLRYLVSATQVATVLAASQWLGIPVTALLARTLTAPAGQAAGA